MHFVKKQYIKKLLIFFVYILGLGFPIYGTEWYQVNTPNFDILFPKIFVSEIQPLANKLEILYNLLRKSMLYTKTKRLSLILKKNTFHNAYFQLCPRKIDMFYFPTASPFFLGNGDWLEMLCIHEGRHHMQSDYCFFNMPMLVRNTSIASIFDMAIPKWFDEGDAVAIETALSRSGRGRIPQFGLLYRTNLLERGVFGYFKQMGMDSYKHRVTNDYPSGYFLVTYLRRKYGNHVIGEIYKNSVNSLLLPFIFPNAVKKVTGRTLLQIHRDAHQELLTFWKQQLDGLPITPVEVVHTRSVSKYKNTEFIDYLYPQFYDAEHIIVYTTGIGTLAKFVLVNIASHLKNNHGNAILPKQVLQKEISPKIEPSSISKEYRKSLKSKKKVLCLPRKPSFNYFSAAKEKIIWIESRMDPFVGDKCMHTTIQLYNILTQKHKQLTSLGRYNIAVLSPDAMKIVAVESSTTYQHRLIILDANNGHIICRIPNPNNYYYMTPSWTEDGQEIVVLRTAEQKSTIVRINIKTGNEESIYPVSEEHISHPKIYKNYLFYNSAYSGIDNIYAMDLDTKQRFQVTSRKYGAYHPVISKDGAWILFNDFTKDGMDVVKIPFNPKAWIPIEQIAGKDIEYYEPLIQQEGNNHPIFDPKLLHHYYPIKKYQPWKGFLNFSKLGFEHISINPITINGALELQDVLETMNIGVHGFLKSKNQKSFKKERSLILPNQRLLGLLLKIKYSGWYPTIRLEGKVSRAYNYNKNNISSVFNRYRMQGSLEFPYHMQYRLFIQKISILFGLKGCSRKEFILDPCVMYDGLARKLVHFYCIKLCNYREITKRDLCMPFQELQVFYAHTPYLVLGNVTEKKLRLDLMLDFPGLIKHHAIRIHPTYIFLFKKIWDHENREQEVAQYRRHDFLHTFSYQFPLFYPDWSEGLLFYLKRIWVELKYESQYKYIPEYQFYITHIDNKYQMYKKYKGIKENIGHVIAGKFYFDFFLLSWKCCLRLGLGVAFQKIALEDATNQKNSVWQFSRFLFDFSPDLR